MAVRPSARASGECAALACFAALVGCGPAATPVVDAGADAGAGDAGASATIVPGPCQRFGRSRLSHYDQSAAVGYATVSARGDFDGDGLLDVALGKTSYTSASGHVQLFVGRGDGTFEPRSWVDPGGGDGGLVAAGDFDDDGFDDLAVWVIDSAGSHLGWLHGSAAGLTDPVALTGLGSITDVTALASDDVNGDGIDDLVELRRESPASRDDSTQIGVRLGAAVDALAVEILSPAFVRTLVSSMELGDVDGDGDPDVVVSDPSLATAIDVLLDDGTGRYDDRSSYTFPELARLDPHPIGVGDVTGDGRADVVVIGDYGDGGHAMRYPTLLRSDGHGSFDGELVVPRPMDGALWVADVSGDGRSDLLVLDGDWNVAVLVAAEDGTFLDEGHADPGRNFDLIVDDFDRDGTADLLDAATWRALEVFPGRCDPPPPSADATGSSVRACTGSATFAETAYALGTLGADALRVADVDGDGARDVVIGGAAGVGWMRGRAGDPARPLEALASLDATACTGIAVGPMGASGTAIVVANGDAGWTVLDPSSPSGVPTRHAPSGIGSLRAPTIATLDATAGPDLAFVQVDGVGSVSLALVPGGIDADWFVVATPWAVGVTPLGLVVLDLDLDGVDDLVALGGSAGEGPVGPRVGGCVVRGPITAASACVDAPISVAADTATFRPSGDGLVLVAPTYQQLQAVFSSADAREDRGWIAPSFGWTTAGLGSVRTAGVVDLVLAAKGGGFSVFADHGPTGSFDATPTLAGDTARPLDALVVADLDGDGIEDVLGTTHATGGDTLTVALRCPAP